MTALEWALAGVMQAATPATTSDVDLYGCPPSYLNHIEAPAPPLAVLRLERVTCAPFDGNPSDIAIVSPDGNSVARWGDRTSAESVDVASLDAKKIFSIPSRATFRGFGHHLLSGFGSGPDALAWSNDSESLWAVRQETASPSGFALTGLVPIRISLDGRVRVLTAPTHSAGPLDAIQWIDGDGLALAQFGTRGGYYRPEHADPSPTFAIIDAARSRVRASFRANDIAELRTIMRMGALPPLQATGAVLPDRHIRAVFRFGPWAERPEIAPDGSRAAAIRHVRLQIVWTEGQAPKSSLVRGDAGGNAIALTPDGSKLLVVRLVQPLGIRVDDCHNCPPSPPPTPVTAPIAELTDVASGWVLWRLMARATDFWSQHAAPAISRDGQYALVEMPPEGRRSMIALIALKDGSVVQRFSAVRVGSYPQSFGFTADGRRVWLACGDTVFRYRLSK